MKITILIVSTLLLVSCEGMRSSEGYLIDSKTLSPIDSVYCNVLSGNYAEYSDSLGHFSVSNRMGHCMPKCKDIEVEFSKPGYKSLKLTNPKEDKIYLTKE